MIIPAGIPSGTIFAYAGVVLPSGGYDWCDGGLSNRSVHASLFAAIGTSWGAGDGSTTFHRPDMRGRFGRGSDNMGTGAAGRDPNAASRTASNAGGNTGAIVGTVQGDDNKSHSHSYSTFGGGAGGSASPQTSTLTVHYPFNTASSGGGEARPQNVNVNYIIKI